MTPGKASWTPVLAILHEHAPPLAIYQPTLIDAKTSETIININEISTKTSGSVQDTQEWKSLSTRPLTRYGSTTCIVISRTTLVTLLVLCNGRTMFRYSDASGHRASYASYCGHWYINWPLDAAATVYFAPHDSHNKSTDVYPPSFRVRVDKCAQMLASIVTTANSKCQCAFPGRKQPGTWVLEHQPKGFSGAHGSRHLYNQMGGKVYEVDLLLARRLVDDEENRPDALELHLPSTEKNIQLSMLVPKIEQGVLEHALDCLPWASMSWSIHRGLRDILVAFAKPTMDKYRKDLANKLREAVSTGQHILIANGWAPDFVGGSMAELAAHSVMAGSGNSGDSVRVVTDAALLLWGSDPGDLDETTFWREGRYAASTGMAMDAAVALVKCFVLEWSIDFDYQMYHDLPSELLFR